MSLLLSVDLQDVALKGLWITLGVLVFVIVYRLVLRRMKRDIPDLSSFIILHPLEMDPAYGEVEFYFTMEDNQFVNFSVFDKDGSLIEEFYNKEMEAGPHIVKFDTTNVSNGKYSFNIKTDKQHTMKFFEIKNNA